FSSSSYFWQAQAQRSSFSYCWAATRVESVSARSDETPQASQASTRAVLKPSRKVHDFKRHLRGAEVAGLRELARSLPRFSVLVYSSAIARSNIPWRL